MNVLRAWVEAFRRACGPCPDCGDRWCMVNLFDPKVER